MNTERLVENCRKLAIFVAAVLVVAMNTFAFGASGTWAPTGSMPSAREGHTATLLVNGKVLVAGGTNNGVAINSAELYNHTTGAWASTRSMHVARNLARSILLSNGSVLVVGGCLNDCLSATTNSAELYNPNTGTFTATGSMVRARAEFGVTLLANGQVLVAGGCTAYDQNGCAATTTGAEIYDPTAKTWILGSKMVQARSSYASIMLTTGKVLFVGGENINGVSIANAELYNPSSGTFAATGSMTATRVEHTAVLLATGKVLVSGGYKQTSNVVTPLASAELYNPATGTWTATGSMSTARGDHTSTVLTNGFVLNLLPGKGCVVMVRGFHKVVGQATGTPVDACFGVTLLCRHREHRTVFSRQCATGRPFRFGFRSKVRRLFFNQAPDDGHICLGGLEPRVAPRQHDKLNRLCTGIAEVGPTAF